MTEEGTKKRPYDLLIDNDLLTAYLVISMETFDGKLEKAEVNEFLASKNVAKINQEAVETFVSAVNDGKLDLKIKIAKGALPVAGKNGRVAWAKALVQEKQEADNKVSWYDCKKVSSVQKNRLILKVFPPTEGKDGVDVLGQPIKAKAGKVFTVRAGKSVHVLDDGCSFVADAEGRPFLQGAVLSVAQVLDIASDLNFSTGNVDFNGHVNIKGTVPDLFKVNATGNVEINGCIEGAEIDVGGDLAAIAGIAGKNKCSIKVKGSVAAKYMTNASARIGGDLSVDIEILNSHIIIGGSVTVQKKGIVGGEVIVKGNGEMPEIGCAAQTPTNIVLGDDQLMREEIQVKKKQNKKMEENLNKLKNKINPLKAKMEQLSPDMKKLLTELLLKLKKMEALRENNERKAAKMEIALNNQMNQSTLTVKTRAFPGAVVTIGGARLEITKELTGPMCFKFDHKQAAVKVTSPEE